VGTGAMIVITAAIAVPDPGCSSDTATAVPHERIARLSYRSIRGRPNWGRTLLSANHVIAEI
jgi:hypothetical protein